MGRKTGIVLVGLLWVAAPAGAQEAQRFDSCGAETAQRLSFIEDHLDGKRRYANRWWMAWNGVYVGGILWGGTRAAMLDDAGERADQIVSAVKSGIGLGQNLWMPPPARDGADALRGMPADSAAACAERLARAEDVLRRNAEESREQRFGWIPHAGNLALNAAGALIVTQGFDEKSGWASAALGLVVGEITIWTYPWQAPGALAEYERRFPASGVPQPPAASLHLEPWGNGARLVLRY